MDGLGSDGRRYSLNIDDTMNEKPFCRSKLAACLLVMVILFIITTSVFLGLFVYYYIAYNGSTEICNTTDCVKAGSTEIWNTTDCVMTGSTEICNTPDCVMTAAAMVKKMNLSADPCTDFSEYACGRFYRETVIPDGSAIVKTNTLLDDENRLLMKEIIEEEIKPEQPKYLTSMKRFYISCMNEDQIETTGLSPFLHDTAFLSDWPTLNPKWTNHSLSDTIKQYAAVNILPFFRYEVIQNPKNSSKMVIRLLGPELTLQNYYNQPRNGTIITAYQTYLTEIAVALKANRSVAEQDARDVVDLEIALSKIIETSEDNIMYPLNQLSVMYPHIDIPGALRAVFGTAGITLADNETVINGFSTYIGNLAQVIESSPSRALHNIFGFKYAISRVEALTKHMRIIKQNFDKVLQGKGTEMSRWKYCLKDTLKFFLKGMSKQFVTKASSEKTRTYIKEMTDNLRKVFGQMIEESTWMSQETRKAAYTKLQAIKFSIGYPDTDFQVADLEKFYEHYNLSEDNYYANLNFVNNLLLIKRLRKLQKPFAKKEWTRGTYPANSYNDLARNAIEFPAGNLRPPYFSHIFQDSLNYGGIGNVIGHEIAHGFDNDGVNFDADGNQRNLFQKPENDIFLNRTQCFVDQYSAFHINEINMTLNGRNSLRENIADFEGVKMSIRAYKAHAHKAKEHPNLPGLQLNQDQLFFLAYGQLYCEKLTRENLISRITSTHSPGKYRIIGALQNFEDFAKAFNCPRESYMNPEKKCSVW